MLEHGSLLVVDGALHDLWIAVADATEDDLEFDTISNSHGRAAPVARTALPPVADLSIRSLRKIRAEIHVRFVLSHMERPRHSSRFGIGL
jgi:hypothetical protein